MGTTVASGRSVNFRPLLMFPIVLETLQDDDLRLQFGNRLGGGRLVNQRFLEVLPLLSGQFVVVGQGVERLSEGTSTAIPELLVVQPGGGAGTGIY